MGTDRIVGVLLVVFLMAVLSRRGSFIPMTMATPPVRSRRTPVGPLGPFMASSPRVLRAGHRKYTYKIPEERGDCRSCHCQTSAGCEVRQGARACADHYAYALRKCFRVMVK